MLEITNHDITINVSVGSKSLFDLKMFFHEKLTLDNLVELINKQLNSNDDFIHICIPESDCTIRDLKIYHKERSKPFQQLLLTELIKITTIDLDELRQISVNDVINLITHNLTIMIRGNNELHLPIFETNKDLYNIKFNARSVDYPEIDFSIKVEVNNIS